MKHELKIWPPYYQRVADGSKTFEVRNNDRAFQMGDTVLLREWDPAPENPSATKHQAKGYTDSPVLEAKVGYVHVLDDKTVIFSLLGLKKAKA